MSKKSKTLELEFTGYDYSKIIDFTFPKVSIRCGEKKITEEEKVEREKIFWANVLLDVFIHLEGKLKSKVNDNQIYIGCSQIREEKGGMSLFKDGDSVFFVPNIESQINGIVGSLSVSYNKLLEQDYKHNKTYINNKSQYDNVQINIKIFSRFDRSDNLLRSFFTATMLTYGKIDKLNDSVPCDFDNLFDFLLIDILARKLEKAQAKGFYRTYRRFEENNEKLRGSIDIARHIRLNSGMQNGRVAYRYRENTTNNYLNILILKAYKHAKRRYPKVVEWRIENNRILRDFFSQITYETDEQSVSMNTTIMKNLLPISHPFYFEYEEVRQVCLQILRDQGVSIFDSNKGSASGFIYYIPDLWEDYLEGLFKRILSDEEIGMTVASQEEKGFISEDLDSENYICTSRPDFVFFDRTNGNCRLILDAKMIPGMEEILNNGRKSQKSYSGAIDKCIRDMDVFGAKGTGVIFPIEVNKSYYDKCENNTEELKLLFSEKYYLNCIRKIRQESEKLFYVIPFPVPLSDQFNTYAEWRNMFNFSEKMYLNYLHSIWKK